jgi:cytoskeleton protein RodZ
MSGGTSSTELPNNGGVLSGSAQGTAGSSTSGSAAAPGATAGPEAAASAGTGSASIPVAPSAAASASAPANVPAAAPVRAKADVASSGEVSREALTLKLAEDSWVQLKQPDGNVILSQVFKAGSSESIPVSGPVVLTIGNAKGVKASFRGAPLDLPRQTKSNVARLDLK